MRRILGFCLLLLLCTSQACISSNLRSSKTKSSPLFHPAKFQSLDMGLYWFGSQQKCQKAKKAQDNPYYKPNRPTVLYVHGWQQGLTRNRMREDFLLAHAGGPKVDITRAWRAKGWNLGALYWNQLADEDDVQHAEAKIWSRRGPKGMRWLTQKNGYKPGNTLQAPWVSSLARCTFVI